MKRMIKFCVVVGVLTIIMSSLTVVTATSIRITPQSGHTGEITSIAYSSNGRFLISGSNDTTIKVWDVATGALIRTLSGHIDTVSTVAWIPNSMNIVSGSWDSTIKIWDATTGLCSVSINASTGFIHTISVSPDGKYILSADADYNLSMWDSSNLKNIRITPLESNIFALAYSPDGKTIAAAHDDGTVTIRNAQTHALQKTLKGHTEAVYSIAFSPDTTTLVTGSYDTTVKIWNTKSSKCIHTLKGHESWVNAVAFSMDGTIVASGSADSTIKIWNVADGRLRLNIPTYDTLTKSIVFSKVSNELTAGGTNRNVNVYTTLNGKIIRTFTGYTQRLSNAEFSPEGNAMLTGSEESSAIIWDLKDMGRVQSFNISKGSSHNAVFSPDGRYFAAAHDLNNSVTVWDSTNGKIYMTLQGHQERINRIIFSPNSKLIASCGWDGLVKIWDISTGMLLQTLKGHQSAVWSVVFTPDSTHMVSCGEDRTIQVWNVRTGSIEGVMNGHTSAVTDIAISPDSKKIVSCSLDGSVKIWDLDTKKLLQTIIEQKDYFYSVRWPQPTTIITGSKNKEILVIDTLTGTVMRTFKGHNDSVMSTHLSSNATLIVSASTDGSAKIWEYVTGKEIAQYIPFTNGEWIIVTPDGFFTGSSGGARYINVVQGMNVLPIDSFFDIYYRPDIINARLQLKDISSVNSTDLTKNFKNPPKISIALKDQKGQYIETKDTASLQSCIENGRITIRVIAYDNGGGVKGVRVFNNDKSVGENIRAITVKKEKENRWDFIVTLAEGENTIRVVGFSDDMTESVPVSIMVPYSKIVQEKPNMYVLAVGINSYKNSKYNLTYCVADVTGFLNILRPKAEKIFGTVQTTVITDRDATKENIIAALNAMRQRIQVKDVFVLFYAGHGIALDTKSNDGTQRSEFYYVLSDVTQMTDTDKCVQDALSGSELKKQLTEINASKQVLFVDACNSGAFAAQFALRGAAEENALAKLSRATGSVVFASTTQDQFASEFKELQHGVFTYVVIEALEGKGALANGQLTVKSIMGYVEDKIPEYTQKYKGDPQYPTTFMHGQDFPLGIK